MKPEHKTTQAAPSPVGEPNLSEPARRAWAVKFIAPTPKSMPADRLKARAELVRTALSSGTY